MKPAFSQPWQLPRRTTRKRQHRPESTNKAGKTCLCPLFFWLRKGGNVPKCDLVSLARSQSLGIWAENHPGSSGVRFNQSDLFASRRFQKTYGPISPVTRIYVTQCQDFSIWAICQRHNLAWLFKSGNFISCGNIP